MASRNSIAILLALNLIFFNLVTAQNITTCPVDTLQLGVCANVLGLIDLNLGRVPTQPCCSLLGNLVALEVGACLCTALDLNLLNLIHLTIPISLSLLVNTCNINGTIPSGWSCP
uniref:LEDI-2 protein n=1 Tax=Lithospermum erythrorhizon TaxID=34254 RepID=Q9ARE8_LITER|nr:LEDI-2 protein [Lithospermum erythrorhizon]